MNNENHLPGALVGGSPGSPRMTASVVLRYPPVGVDRVADVGPALEAGVGAVEQVDPKEILHHCSTLRGPRVGAHLI